MTVVSTIDYKVDSLMSLMTLDEKIGQMNQYNGFWDITGPKQDKLSQEKITHLRHGLVGSMLNVTGVDEVNLCKIAVEESRLGIPLIIGFDVIHGFKTISPILGRICKLGFKSHTAFCSNGCRRGCGSWH